MNPTAIERYFPTFTPPARRFLLVIDAIRRYRGRPPDAKSVCRQVFVAGHDDLVLVVGSGLGWVVRRPRIQREAVAGVKRAGGTAWYDWQWKSRPAPPRTFVIMPDPRAAAQAHDGSGVETHPGQYKTPQTSSTSWLTPGPGAEYFSHVVQISLGPQAPIDLVPIGYLDRLEILDLNSSAVTDAGMVHLEV